MQEDKLVKAVAAERIGRLLRLAYERTERHDTDALSKRYVRLAREISAHYKVRMQGSEKLLFCKSCNAILIPGRTCTVRLASANGYAVYRCTCGAERKAFYK